LSVPTELLLAGTIVFLATFVRGFTGFGGALIMVPLLALVWDIRAVIVIVGLLQTITGVQLVRASRKLVDRPRLSRLLAGSLIGLAAGTLLLAILPVIWIARILGVFTIAVGGRIVLELRGVRPESIEPSRVATVGVSLLAGTLHGLIGTSGPVIVPYLHRIMPSAGALRATLLAYFCALDVLRLIGYAPLGLISAEILWLSAVLLPAGVVGSLLGCRLHLRVRPQLFQLAVGALLCASGALLILR
jgi:hypothetical protein